MFTNTRAGTPAKTTRKGAEDLVEELGTEDAAIANYEQELVAFKEYEEKRKKSLKEMSAKDIDAQIQRAEHRLANLKAAKAGQPIPFPQG